MTLTTTLTETLGDSVQYLRRHVFRLSKLLLPAIIPSVLFSVWIEDFLYEERTLNAAIRILVILLVQPYLISATLFYIASDLDDKPQESIVALAVKVYLPMVWVYLVVSVATVTGYFLLFVPGLYLSAKLAFAPIYVVTGQAKPNDCFQQSFDDTAGFTVLLMLGYAICLVGLYLPYYLILWMFPDNYYVFILLTGLLDIAFAIPYTIFTIFAFRVYSLASARQGKTE